MHKRLWMSITMAVILLALLVISVTAQTTVDDEDTALDETSATLFAIEPVTATVDQQVPLSLTLRIPLGPTETQTVTIPLLLSLNLQLTLGEFVSPSLAITAELAALTDVVTSTLPTATLVAAPTLPPSPTPTALPPTATPLPPQPTPTTAPETEPEATPETEPEAEPETQEPPAPEDGIVLVPECADPRSVIFFPGVNQVIAAAVDVVGSATHEDFAYYKLEYALGADAGSAADYFYFGGGNSPVENGLLAQFDTTALPNGLYTLRLTVVDSSGNFPAPCPVTVQVEN